MHYAFTEVLVADIAGNLELSPRLATDLVERFMANDRDRRLSGTGDAVPSRTRAGSRRFRRGHRRAMQRQH